jgi:DNA polymerase
VFTLDLLINTRGFQLDAAAVKAALVLLAREQAKMNAELTKLTGGTVTKATQRARLNQWFYDEGLSLPDTKGPTVDGILDSIKQGRRRDVSAKAQRGLEILRSLGRSSTAKYQAMENWAAADWRVRGGLRYHGANTGRWAGAGVQPHNFPRGGIKDPEALWAVIKRLEEDAIAAFEPDPKKPGKKIGSVMKALSEGLRGTIIAISGKQLFVADFSSIEARVLLWLAEDEDGLDIFRSGRDIYCEMASSPSLFNRPIKKSDEAERQLGKATILGCGYQMGPAKFVTAAATYGVQLLEDLTCRTCGQGSRFHRENHPFRSTEDPNTMTAVRTVNAYREKFWRVVEEWAEQEHAAKEAMLTSGEGIEAGCVTWFTEGRFLYCQLPSGRRLAYPDPKIEVRFTSWGQPKETLTYMGVNPITRQWERQATYGGKLVENIVQAIARDLMVVGMLAAEAAGYEIILTVHDEMIAEKATGSIEEFCRLMTTIPDWAPGCPVAAEGWSGTRYKK